MTRTLIIRYALVVAVVLNVRSSIAATPEQIDLAIERAKAHVYARQNPAGNWEIVETARNDVQPYEPAGLQFGGLTAIAVTSLLATGEKPNDPKLARAIQFLKTAPINGVYALAMRQQVWPYLRNDRDTLQYAKRDAKLMMQAVIKDGKDRGFYGYSVTKTSESGDRSAGQYGVLGMWAAERSGVEVPTEYWKLIEQAWIANQEPSGAWMYKRPIEQNRGESINMTAGGVATLLVTQDFTSPGSGQHCRGNILNPSIDRGIAWLEKHFSTLLLDNGPDYPGLGSDRRYILYGMYGIERVGVASGRKYIGSLDWYQAGADYLIKVQANDGKWDWYDDNIPGTCYGILYLVRGRAPVTMNKLKYQIADKEGNWNQRPRDVANFTKWLGGQLERELNWQIVDLQIPVDALSDAPILYLAGNQSLSFTKEETDKLRHYVEAGGLILGNADCSNKQFADSFKALGSTLFSKYEFRPLPPEHPINTLQTHRLDKFKVKPNLQGLSNGVRELMILIPDQDAARVWQTATERTTADSLKIGANVFQYCSDNRNLKTKDISATVVRNPKVTAAKKLSIARLEYAGNWDPEPGGLRRMVAIVHNRDKIELELVPVIPGENKLDAFKIAFLTGTEKVRFNEAQRNEIKAFLKKGGVLLADAAGGSQDFAASIQAELDALFPNRIDKNRSVLAGDHPLFSAGGSPLAKVSYRAFTKQVVGRLDAPQVLGFSDPGIGTILYSPLDISHGLLGTPVDGVAGYAPESAVELFRKMILYADQIAR